MHIPWLEQRWRRTGLKRLTRYGTATLLIGANLPDIDIIAAFWGRDTSLLLRRGWTHGVLALVVLPLLLAGAVWLWHRWRRHKADSSDVPYRLGGVLALSFLAVWSHPLLDWLNTYGVRLLMPFDDSWFYGDTLFIVDPWLWLLAATGVVIARSNSGMAIVGWGLLAAAATALILLTGFATVYTQVLWFTGLTVLFALRWKKRESFFELPLARISAAMLLLYICTVYGVARVAESMAEERFPKAAVTQSNPVPGAPFSNRVLIIYDDFYRILSADGETYEVPRESPDTIVQTALESESIRGFVNWMRFPYWTVEEMPDSWRVSIWDLRYQGPDLPKAAIGFVQVDVPKDTTMGR